MTYDEYRRKAEASWGASEEAFVAVGAGPNRDLAARWNRFCQKGERDPLYRLGKEDKAFLEDYFRVLLATRPGSKVKALRIFFRRLAGHRARLQKREAKSARPKAVRS